MQMKMQLDIVPAGNDANGSKSKNLNEYCRSIYDSHEDYLADCDAAICVLTEPLKIANGRSAYMKYLKQILDQFFDEKALAKGKRNEVGILGKSKTHIFKERKLYASKHNVSNVGRTIYTSMTNNESRFIILCIHNVYKIERPQKQEIIEQYFRFCLDLLSKDKADFIIFSGDHNLQAKYYDDIVTRYKHESRKSKFNIDHIVYGVMFCIIFSKSTSTVKIKNVSKKYKKLEHKPLSLQVKFIKAEE